MTRQDCAGAVRVHAVPWSHTTIDNVRSAPIARIETGVSWSWDGYGVEVPLGDAASGEDDIRAAAARAVRRMFGQSLPARKAGIDADDAVFERAFTISDGRRHYRAQMVELAEIARPLLVFTGPLPPANCPLTVTSSWSPEEKIIRHTEEPTGVICFTPGTRLLTPDGLRPVEDLGEGDRVSTKDDGDQEILWIGSRRMSGARLYAMPELRPIRIRSGAIDGAIPEPDLIVSPQHRIVLQGRIAEALFGTPEVLVTAKDLKDDRGILTDRTLQDVTYIHILLPRHQIVWANGVETESFHPASTDLATIGEDQRARLLGLLPAISGDPKAYGAPARRTLTQGEAAIFSSEATPRH
ncbi:MAG: Hint domain-containing protein [Pseudomonadota bacterium]